MKGKNAIRFTASNADFLIWHSKCLLPLKENALYLLEFKVKGDNSDFGATLPYFFFYQDTNENISTRVTIYEGYKNGTKGVDRVEADEDGNGNVAIRIKTVNGYETVISSFDGDEVDGPYGMKSGCYK